MDVQLELSYDRFSRYGLTDFIQGEDPCFSLVQPEGGVRVSEGGAADAAPCAYGSADGAGAGLFILKGSSE